MLLDGLATAAIALVAATGFPVAIRLGAAMVALQASIGALNDLMDHASDAIAKPAKPLPRGEVSPALAIVVAAGGAGAGIGLAALSGPVTVAVAGAILGVGYAYDLRFKGTPWSWLPFAVGIPLLPVFAWLGARGELPDAFGVLIPAAVAAGAALAMANARADFERDLASGTGSVAVALGLERAWRAHAVLWLAVVGLAVGSLAARATPGFALPLTIGAGGALLVGVVLGREGDAARRERAWELEAVSVALLAAAWLVGWGELR